MQARTKILSALAAGPLIGLALGIAADPEMLPGPEPAWRQLDPDPIFTAAEPPPIAYDGPQDLSPTWYYDRMPTWKRRAMERELAYLTTAPPAYDPYPDHADQIDYPDYPAYNVAPDVIEMPDTAPARRDAAPPRVAVDVRYGASPLDRALGAAEARADRVENRIERAAAAAAKTARRAARVLSSEPAPGPSPGDARLSPVAAAPPIALADSGA